MTSTSFNTALTRMLLLQLGDQLMSRRKAMGLSAVETAKRAKISRTTLKAVEAGAPGTSIGSLVRVMSALGISGDLVHLASGWMIERQQSAAANGTRLSSTAMQVLVSADDSRHRIQDLQSLVLHEEAVRLVQKDSTLLLKAQNTLERWLRPGGSRSDPLWLEWRAILKDAAWRKVLGNTQRAQQLRQASPLTTVLPEETRLQVLAQIGEIKRGIVLSITDGTRVRTTHINLPLLEQHDLVLKGIPANQLHRFLASFSVLSEVEILTMLGASRRDAQRRKRGLLGPEASGALLDLMVVVQKAEEVLGAREAAETWLHQPAVAFEGRRPIELLSTRQGAKLVKDHLTRMDYGVYV
jgi:putative toxin-antitoxin system antitoxin component (TIGR02293 family)